MSLGFTSSQRTVRPTNLPGAVGAATIPLPNRRRQRMRLMGKELFAQTPPPPRRAAPEPPTSLPTPTAPLLPTRRDPEPVQNLGNAALFSGRIDYLETAMKRTHVAFDDEEQRRIESIQQVYEECQWAYATALHDVPDAVDSNTIVVKSGARVMVTYPMRKGIDDRVEMKIKNIDKDTGQLIASWVVAYDAKQRFLGDFGISP